jgi:signal transduction histidine kinase
MGARAQAGPLPAANMLRGTKGEEGALACPARMERANREEFGLAGIFDNVRDGLILVRFPQQEIVLFNRAASEMCGVPIPEALAMRMDQVFTDPEVHRTARMSSEQPVGIWPGHAQEVLQTRLAGTGRSHRVEVHFCRVEDVGRGGPLVLLVMRPSSELELEAAAAEGAKARRRLEELETEAEAHTLFFNEAAHEFKTPLTIVALQAELLATGRMDGEQERALSIINANVHRLVLLSQDLVDLA